METPSSERQLSRASAFGSVNSAIKPGKGSATRISGSRRRPLLDLTNDSPISGLALDRDDEPETPTPNTTRRYLPDCVKTPGTGESLLRHQVRSLLQRVEADTRKPVSNLQSLCHLNGYTPSPSRLLAPTPVNTPDSAVLPNPFATGNNGLLSNESDQTIESRKESSVNSSKEITPRPEVIDAVKLNATSPEKPLPRTLMFDSMEEADADADADAEASIASPSSVISSEDGQKLRNLEDDDVSVWSMQVNISSPCPEQADDYAPGENDGHVQADDFSENEVNEDDEENELSENQECLELCEELRRVSVHDDGVHLEKIPPFAGRHTRFVYNSDDDLEGVEVVSEPLPVEGNVQSKEETSP